MANGGSVPEAVSATEKGYHGGLFLTNGGFYSLDTLFASSRRSRFRRTSKPVLTARRSVLRDRRSNQ